MHWSGFVYFSETIYSLVTSTKDLSIQNQHICICTFYWHRINLLCSAFNAIISTLLFYIFQKRCVLWSIPIHDQSTNLLKFWTSFEEMRKKISYILDVCIPCSPLSFKGVYKILAINFQSGHNMHRCLESVLLKLHFYYCLFSCTLLWTSIFKFE